MQLLRNAILISALFPLLGWSQSPAPTDPAVAAADKAYTAQNWADAESQYAALTQRSPEIRASGTGSAFLPGKTSIMM